MHNKVHDFIKEVRAELPYKFRLRTVLDVGSHDINGSPRKYFKVCDYTGIDLTPGKGVDVVSRFVDCKFTRQYEVVISTEMLEHDETWQKSLVKMYDLLENGGLLLITCAGPARKEHGTKRTTPECSPDTTDYYRNISIGDFMNVLPPELFDEYILQYARGQNDFQAYAIKRGPKNPRSVKYLFGLVKIWAKRKMLILA